MGDWEEIGAEPRGVEYGAGMRGFHDITERYMVWSTWRWRRGGVTRGKSSAERKRGTS
jgi:hypothetical protein